MLLREVLDPAVENIQQAKQQRERIWNDTIYFTSTKRPKNAPDWTYSAVNYYETEATATDYEEELDRLQIEEEFDRLQDVDDQKDHEDDEYDRKDEEEYYNHLIQNRMIEDELPDFIRNSAEMNEIRPEDLDEEGESSTMGTRRGSQVCLVIIFIGFDQIRIQLQILFICRKRTKRERKGSFECSGLGIVGGDLLLANIPA